MTDHSLPEPSDEFASMRVQRYPKNLQTMINNFTQRIRMTRTLGALQTVRRDIEQGGIMTNFAAKEQLRGAANARAREIDHQMKGDWWS